MSLALRSVLTKGHFEFIENEFERLVNWAAQCVQDESIQPEAAKSFLLRQAAEITGDSKYEKLAEENLYNALQAMFKFSVAPILFGPGEAMLAADLLYPGCWDQVRSQIHSIQMEYIRKLPHPVDIDLIKGLSGTMKFFLETADRPESQEALALCFDHMLLDRFEDEDGWFWLMYPQFYRNEKPEINLSLSHGTLGWLGSLADYTASPGTKPPGAIAALLNAYNWLIANVQNRSLPSTLPFEDGRKGIMHESRKASLDRVAWCYGMLGGGFAIHAAEKALGIDSGHALSFFERMGKVPVEQSGSLYDNVVCHGAIGNLFLFAEAMRLFPSSIVLQQALTNWMNNNIAFKAKFMGSDEPRAYLGNSTEAGQGIKSNPHSILTGSTGAGLVYGSLLGSTAPWHRMLNISYRWAF